MEKFRGQKVDEAFKLIDFSKASPDAINVILDALNAEVDQALVQNRFPTLDRALGRLGPSTSFHQ
jgi:hypothetical protein